MAEPLRAEERAEFWAASGWDRGDILKFADRYEATCRALEAERDRLRAALEPLERVSTWPDCCDQCEAIIAVRAALAPDPPEGT